ncbi:MAG: hypothetical protein LQ343_000851 [Gyalolechia ehrenbergii]|nr:MAG: hypothetical protein LQ343_000851 [Gyalolechia ehrenbergii]
MGYNPATDIPDLSKKTFLITGGTNGLGKQSILTLSKHSPEHIYFTGRNAKAADDIISQTKTVAPNAHLTFIECDQLSLASVQVAAQSFLSQASKLDVLIANAGVMATDAALSKDGYENQFATNHIAHALLVKLLLPTLESTASKAGEARVLFLTSLGFMYPFPDGVQFNALKTTQDFGPGSQWARYGQSKLANVQYPAELARRYPDITWLSLHPGTVNTDIIGRLKPDEKELVYQMNKVIVEPEEGVYNTCWAATTKKSDLVNGELYLPVGQKGEHTKQSADKELQGKLWAWTQEELRAFN